MEWSSHLLHLTGLNHERRNVGAQDLDVRLTGVNPAKVLPPPAGLSGSLWRNLLRAAGFH